MLLRTMMKRCPACVRSPPAAALQQRARERASTRQPPRCHRRETPRGR